MLYIRDNNTTNPPKKGFPVWAGYTIAGVLIAIILFLAIYTLRKLK